MKMANNVKRINIDAKRIVSSRIDIAFNQEIFIESDIRKLNEIVQLRKYLS